MELTRSEENRNKTISAGITLLVFALILLFLILKNIVTPNPPFPNGSGEEAALGIMTLSAVNPESDNLNEADPVITKARKTIRENIVTDPDGVITNIKKEKMKYAEKTDAEKLADKFKKANELGKNQDAVKKGRPDGDPLKNGTAISGSVTGISDRNGSEPVKIIIAGEKIGFNLPDRSVIASPKFPSDTKEEGKVIVEITVDKEGNVIEANPNGRGTTTSSSNLKQKAKQVALATKFNVGKFDEQNGSITIIFTFD